MVRREISSPFFSCVVADLKTGSGAWLIQLDNEAPRSAVQRQALREWLERTHKPKETAKLKETDAKTVIVNMVKALNEHLIDGQEAYWADDAVWRGPAGAGVKKSLKQIYEANKTKSTRHLIKPSSVLALRFTAKHPPTSHRQRTNRCCVGR